MRPVLCRVIIVGALGASSAYAQANKAVEEVVDLDALDAPPPPPPAGQGSPSKMPPSSLSATGSVVEEVVDLDRIDGEGSAGASEAERHPWLALLPLLPLLVLMWNVDWREARVKEEIHTARAHFAPKKKKPAPAPAPSVPSVPSV